MLSSHLSRVHSFLARFLAEPASPDFSRLPLVARQATDWQLVARIRVSPAGFQWFDPASGVRCTKLTDERSPVGNTGTLHDYSTPSISHLSARGRHFALLTARGRWALASYERGMGLRGYVTIPDRLQPGHDTCCIPSSRAETPTVFYVCRGRVLRKFEVQGSECVEVTTRPFPKQFSARELPDEDGGRLQVDLLGLVCDAKDRWFAMQSRVGGGPHSAAVLWDAQTDTTIRLTPRDLGLTGDLGIIGIAVVHDGRYVHLVTDNDPSRAFKQTTSLWYDLETRMRSDRYDATLAYSGHDAIVRDGVVTFDANSSELDLLIHRAPRSGIRRNGQAVEPMLFERPPAGRNRVHQAYHVHAPWAVGASPSTRWVMPSDYGEVLCTLGTWVRRGERWECTVTGFGAPAYGRSAESVMSCVLAPIDRSGYNVTLRRLATAAALSAPWQWAFDPATSRLSVTLLDGEPHDRILLFAAPSGIGLIQFVREDGREARHLVHHGSAWRGWDDGYWATPRACVSPDASLVMWTSNMGRFRGRTDVYVAEVPLV
jgi:hypothetical protein